MEVIIKCDCGNEITLVPETQGNVSFAEKNMKNIFTISTDIGTYCNVEKDEFVPDSFDADVEINSCDVRIDCNNCGEYIILRCK